MPNRADSPGNWATPTSTPKPPAGSEGGLARRVVEALGRHGAQIMFGVPGGGPNLDVVGAAVGAGFRFVLTHGETAAAIMASTHGLLTGTPSAVVVTRGPGAASATNGLAQATLDRAPVVAITDTVPTPEAARVPHQRLDQRALLAPVSKTSATVADTTDRAELHRLVGAALRWPFGAVHLDYDPGATMAPPPAASPAPSPSPGVANGAAAAPGSAVARARELVASARRPVIIAGFEAAATAGGRLGPILCRCRCPVFTTYQAVGLVPTEGADSAGLFTNGAAERPMLAEADVIVTVGLDLVEPIPAPWTYEAQVVRLSSQPATDPYLPAHVEVVGDLVAVAAEVLGSLPGDRSSWAVGAGAAHREDVRRRLRTGPDPHSGPEDLGPIQLVEVLTDRADRFGTVTVDAGAHFLAIMPLWPVAQPLRLLISNGLATMGYALPAAIGAALARPDEPVLALTGDGGLSMVVSELETIARLGLPITVVVLNDAALSLIEIKQRPEHGGADAVRYRPIDFAAVARGLGVEADTVVTVDELSTVLDRTVGLASASEPRLIDARIDPSSYPHLLQVTRG